MKRLIAFMLMALAACSEGEQTDATFTSNPIVASWPDTTDLKHIHGSLAYNNKDSSLYLSRLHSWNKVALNSDLQWGNLKGTLTSQADLKTALDAKLNIAGGNMTGNLGVQSGAANKVLIAMNLGGSSSSGNSTFGPSAYYLGLGHREWGVGTYRLIGFGFRYTANDHYPVVMGYQETSGTSSTFGELIFATRNTTSNSAPTVRMRIQAGGNIKAYGPIADPQDVTTKGYVDTAYKQVRTVTTAGAVSLVGVPNGNMITNNASAATTYTLPPAKAGASYEFWKVGTAVMTIVGPIADVNKIGTKTVSGTESSTFISLKCNGANWIVTSKTGTWTTQ